MGPAWYLIKGAAERSYVSSYVFNSGRYYSNKAVETLKKTQERLSS